MLITHVAGERRRRISLEGEATEKGEERKCASSLVHSEVQ
jgi:hypothetical protein